MNAIMSTITTRTFAVNTHNGVHILRLPQCGHHYRGKYDKKMKKVQINQDKITKKQIVHTEKEQQKKEFKIYIKMSL